MPQFFYFWLHPVTISSTQSRWSPAVQIYKPTNSICRFRTASSMAWITYSVQDRCTFAFVFTCRRKVMGLLFWDEITTVAKLHVSGRSAESTFGQSVPTNICISSSSTQSYLVRKQERLGCAPLDEPRLKNRISIANNKRGREQLAPTITDRWHGEQLL